MCDLLCAVGPRAAGDTTLFAKNSDRPPGEPQDLEWSPPRQERTTRATHVSVAGAGRPTLGVLGSRPRWMWGYEHGVNQAGVAAGNATVYTTLDPRGRPDALTGMDLVRLALERGDSAAAAVEVLLGLLAEPGQGGSGHRDRDRPYWSSFLVVDAGRAFVVETSGPAHVVEEVGPGGAWALSNRTTVPSFDAEHRHPRQPVATLVDPRLDASRAVLDRAPVTRAALEAHLRAHEPAGEPGWSVCMHVAGVESTTASIVAELPAGGDAVAWCLLGSPCSSIRVPVVVGEPLGAVPAWERFAALSPGDRARLEALETELATSRPPAAEAWAAVAAVLPPG